MILEHRIRRQKSALSTARYGPKSKKEKQKLREGPRAGRHLQVVFFSGFRFPFLVVRMCSLSPRKTESLLCSFWGQCPPASQPAKGLAWACCLCSLLTSLPWPAQLLPRWELVVSGPAQPLQLESWAWSPGWGTGEPKSQACFAHCCTPGFGEGGHGGGASLT